MINPLFFVIIGMILGTSSILFLDRNVIVLGTISVIGLMLAIGGTITMLVTDVIGEGGAIPLIPYSMEMIATVILTGVMVGIISSIAGYISFIHSMVVHVHDIP